ncbi:MAG: NACHT domain-containing protein [Oceanospirillaceae bacterium]
MAKQPKKLGIIQCPPPENHQQMTPSELLKALMIAGDWDGNGLTEIISNDTSKGISLDGIKRWMHNNTIPKGENRDALNRAIFNYCKDAASVDPQQWQNALYQSWIRYSASVKNISKTICQRILNDVQYTHLPPLFVVDPLRKISTDYVELQLLCDATASESKFAKLHLPISLLDKKGRRSYLILGAPGSGKSSLLRSIALDIASDKWQSAKVPLLVIASEYLQAKNSQPHLDLITFALRDFFLMTQTSPNINHHLKQSVMQEKLILLIDGIDEVAIDVLAINALYTELRFLRNSVSWIVVARPAGLMGTLYESNRYSIAQLNNSSIENFIDLWGAKHNLDDNLKHQILKSPSISQLARNPFFLTLFCAAHESIAAGFIANTPIATREYIFDGIKLHAQKNTLDKKVLSLEIVEKLQQFSYQMQHNAQDSALSFDELTWWEFTSNNQVHNDTEDFFKKILPARLITTSNHCLHHYHFLDIGIQQQIIAHSMLTRPIADMLKKRFSEKWRPAFIFYGALLHYRDRLNEFQMMVNTLHNEREINHTSTILLAGIFANLGINNTQRWVNSDIRSLLYNQLWTVNQASCTVLKTLVKLDHQWLEQKLNSNIESAIQDTINECSSPSADNTSYRLMTAGQEALSAYKKLSSLNTLTSYRFIAAAFWGDNTEKSLLAAGSYAEIIIPSQRHTIIALSKKDNLPLPTCYKILAFVSANPCLEFIPFLQKLSNDFINQDAVIFKKICDVLIDLGGPAVVPVFEHLLLHQSKTLAADPSAFDTLLSAIETLSFEYIQRLLSEKNIQPYIPDWRQRITSTMLIITFNEPAISKAIEESENLRYLIAAIAIAANKKRHFSAQLMLLIVQKISLGFNIFSFELIKDLATIELIRIKSGRSTSLSTVLFKFAKHLCYLLSQPLTLQQLQHFCCLLRCALKPLIYALWPSLRALILKTLSTSQNSSLLEVVINAAGKFYENTADRVILVKLEAVLFSGDITLRSAAALAIGRIDFATLNRLQSAENAQHVLASLAAQRGYLVFKNFWTDKWGKCTDWQHPPIAIFYVYDEAATPNITSIFAHEMSRYGFYVSKNICECELFLLFNPTTIPARQQAQLICRQNKLTRSVFHIPKNMPSTLAIILAQNLAQSLSAISAPKRSNSTFSTLLLP